MVKEPVPGVGNRTHGPMHFKFVFDYYASGLAPTSIIVQLHVVSHQVFHWLCTDFDIRAFDETRYSVVRVCRCSGCSLISIFRLLMRLDIQLFLFVDVQTIAQFS